MSKQFFLPESISDIDSEMDLEKLFIFYKEHKTIVGKIIRLDLEKKCFIVHLGGQIMAIMPFDSATIYPLYRDDGNLSPNITSLEGKTIQAKIATLETDNIVLSRKENMLEALEVLKEETEIIFAIVTGFSRMSAFADIGAGIIGRSYGKNFANVVFNTAKDIDIKKGEMISVKIIDYLEGSNTFELSRVDTLPDYHNILDKNDIVNCKVFNSLGDGIGYYVLIDTNFAGIVDSYNEKLKYGDNIIASIKRIAPKGPKLHFIQKR